MLNWADRFNICCFLDNNNYPSPYNRFEALLAADALEYIQLPAGTALPALQEFHDTRRDWLFGHFGYDLMQETMFSGTPGAAAPLPNRIAFPDLYFFRPRFVLLLRQGRVQIGGEGFTAAQAQEVLDACLQMPANITRPAVKGATPPVQGMDRRQYLDAVKALQRHIHRGDCYEVNFCRENYINGIDVYPLALFDRLNRFSPSPFAAYYRLEDKYLACSSPERFLQKQGNTVISQPIKGTIRRAGNAAADEQQKQALYQSPKERTENVMVVDLVRNDLAQTAGQGSVQVKELFGIYSFAQVHHMISTVTAVLEPGTPFTELIRHAFPMGSMTGAPKRRVLQLIEQYEPVRRGLFSGALGYITPEGDLDLNVVIRSILYNAASRCLSFPTGSAITFYCDPEKEWEECLLKAEGMISALKV